MLGLRTVDLSVIDINIKLEKAEMIYVQSNNLLSVHGFAKHDTLVMSKIHSTGLFDVRCHGGKNTIPKLQMVDQYNTFVEGADNCEKYLNSYSWARKYRKWRKKVFFFLVY